MLTTPFFLSFLFSIWRAKRENDSLGFSIPAPRMNGVFVAKRSYKRQQTVRRRLYEANGKQTKKKCKTFQIKADVAFIFIISFAIHKFSPHVYQFVYYYYLITAVCNSTFLFQSTPWSEKETVIRYPVECAKLKALVNGTGRKALRRFSKMRSSCFYLAEQETNNKNRAEIQGVGIRFSVGQSQQSQTFFHVFSSFDTFASAD